MNNYYNPMNNQNPYGAYNNAYAYGQQAAPINYTNPLDAEGEKILKERAPEFNLLEVPREDSLRASCTHRDPATRTLTLQELGNGSYRCTKCGAEFNLTQLDEADVEKFTNSIVDILQTAKLMYLDMPPQSVVAYFQMIPFLEKLPKLYKIAQDTFKRSNAGTGIQGAYTSGNPWMNLQQAVSTSMYNGVPGYGYTAPQQAPPQQGYPQYMNPPQQAGNVFQEGTPVAPYGYQPQQPQMAPGYGQAPYAQPQVPQNNQVQQNVSAPQQVANAAEEKVTTKKSFDV